MKQRLVMCLSALVMAFPFATTAAAEEYITGWRVAKIKIFDKNGAFKGALEPKQLPALRTEVVDRAEPALLGLKIEKKLSEELGTDTVYVMQAQVIWTGSVCPTGYVTAAVASGQQNAGHNAGSSSGSGGCKPSTGGPK